MQKNLLIAAIVVFGLGQFSSSGTAVAAVKTTTRTVYHKVRGDDAASLVKYMFAHPIKNTGNAFAAIKTEFKIDKFVIRPGRTRSSKSNRNASGCHVHTFRIKAKFTIYLPKISNVKRLDAKTRRAWRAFMATLEKHEKTHREINLKLLQRLDKAVSSLATGQSCNTLIKPFGRIFTKNIKKAVAAHKALDNRDRRRAPNLPIFKLAGVTKKNIKAFVADARQDSFSVSQLLLKRSLRDDYD